MAVISGRTSGSIFSTPYNIPAKIISYSLTNVHGSNITTHVSIIDPNVSQVYWRSETISSGDSKTYDIPIILKSGCIINLIVSGDCDYYFNIE